MRIKKTIVSISFVLIGLCSIQAQESTIAAGGEASGTGGSVSFTVGQIAYSTNTGTNGSEIQGVLQPYEISTVHVSEIDLDISLSVFPNPTIANVILQIGEYCDKQLTFQLIDLNGNMLECGEVSSYQTVINTNQLPASTYLIYVLNKEQKQVGSFKILKN